MSIHCEIRGWQELGGRRSLARPLMDYYIGALRYDIEKDLNDRPDLIEKLGIFYNKFIKWCAQERVIFEADINDEVATFVNKFINSRLYNLDVDLWRQITGEVFLRDNFTCKYCGKIGGKLEVDHAIPVFRGGTNNLDNLVTSCMNCNRKKRDKTPQEFDLWRRRSEKHLLFLP